MNFLHDTWLVFQRQILIMWRTPIWIAFGVAQPIGYVLLYAPLLKPALANAGAITQGDAYRIFVPGLLVLMAIFLGLFTGFALLGELRAGVIERARVTPTSRVALLLGRTLRDTVSILIQSLIVILVALPFGLRPYVGSLLLGFLLLGLLVLMASSISYGVSLILRSEGALAPVMNTVAMPLAMLSGVMLPMIYAPDWLRSIAAFNPFAWAVDGIRVLFDGNPGHFLVWKAIGLIALLTVVAMAWASRMFAKAVR